MLTMIDAMGYRCLRDLRQALRPLQVLVGPNASGKTTFLDVVGFLSLVVSEGLEAAVERHTANPLDLVWSKSGSGFSLAIEAMLPDAARAYLHARDWDTVRYEVGVAVRPELEIESERLLVFRGLPAQQGTLEMFPAPPGRRAEPFALRLRQGAGRTVVNKVPGGNDNFYSETYKEAGKGWSVSYKLGRRRSALGNLPEDEEQFPAATWFKRLLETGVQTLMLNSLLLRRASPPGQGRGFKTDGSNLPWVVHRLELAASTSGAFASRLSDWVAHLRTALPDLETVRTVEREDDRHRYLVLRYRSGIEVPSWMASDGTLRLLALTLPAYVPELDGIFLVEEPENGIHPRAVETMFQSLSSVLGAQVLIATHSPIVLNLVDPKDVLCFAKDGDGATSVVSGERHPVLAGWRRETALGDLLAAGVLG